MSFLSRLCKPPSKRLINLAVLRHRQEKDGFPWLFLETAKESIHLLGHFHQLPSKQCVFLAILH
jgi:hypothetical protein